MNTYPSGCVATERPSEDTIHSGQRRFCKRATSPAYRVTIAVPEGIWESVLPATQPSLMVDIAGTHYPKRFKISRKWNRDVNATVVEVVYLNSVRVELVTDGLGAAVEFPVVSRVGQSWVVDGPTEGTLKEAHITLSPAEL